MIYYIDSQPHELLARVRPAGPPFEEQDGSYVGVDYGAAFAGGVVNQRLTFEQATALRDALDAYLSAAECPREVVIAKAPDGTIRRQQH